MDTLRLISKRCTPYWVLLVKYMIPRERVCVPERTEKLHQLYITTTELLGRPGNPCRPIRDFPRRKSQNTDLWNSYLIFCMKLTTLCFSIISLWEMTYLDDRGT